MYPYVRLWCFPQFEGKSSSTECCFHSTPCPGTHLTPSLSNSSKGITACTLGDPLVFNEAETGRDFWGHKRVWGEVGTLKWCEVVVNDASATAGSPIQR